jgi:hypothetical protein
MIQHTQERNAQLSICCGRPYRELMLEENSFGGGVKTKTLAMLRPGKSKLVRSTGFDRHAGGGTST